MGKFRGTGDDDEDDTYASLLYQGNALRQFALRNGSLFRMWHLMRDVDPRRSASKRLRYTRRDITSFYDLTGAGTSRTYTYACNEMTLETRPWRDDRDGMTISARAWWPIKFSACNEPTITLVRLPAEIFLHACMPKSRHFPSTCVSSDISSAWNQNSLLLAQKFHRRRRKTWIRPAIN